MFPNLRAEMARKQIAVSDLATITERSEKAIRDKMSGRTDFTLPEAITIRNRFFTELSMDYLFEREEN